MKQELQIYNQALSLAIQDITKTNMNKYATGWRDHQNLDPEPAWTRLLIGLLIIGGIYLVLLRYGVLPFIG